MPIHSMTGFGEHSILTDNWEVRVRLKSLNHRHLDARINGLDRYPLLHIKVRNALQEAFARGRVDVEVELRRTEQAPSLTFDPALARRYKDELQTLSDAIGLGQTPSLEYVLGMEGVTERAWVAEDTLWAALEPGLGQAVTQAQQMRREEGARLHEALGAIVDALEALTAGIETRVPSLKQVFEQRLRERISAWREEIELDANRLEEELVLYVERGDISEELARLKSHFSAIRAAFADEAPAGKVLDFIAQEVGREVNTLGAKVKDAVVSRDVVSMKCELEKFREQVRNIE